MNVVVTPLFVFSSSGLTCNPPKFVKYAYINDLVQGYAVSITNILEINELHTKRSIYTTQNIEGDDFSTLWHRVNSIFFANVLKQLCIESYQIIV